MSTNHPFHPHFPTPFGSVMLGRDFSSGKYRFGFGGHEKDDELKGEGNHISFNDYGYNARLGRRLQIDPKTTLNPSQSPFSCFNNNPNFYVDPDGEDGIAFWENSGKIKTLVIKADYHYIKGQFDENVLAAVKKEFGTFKKINYNGEMVNVRYEIGFQEHNEGTDLNTYDGANGQNRLIKEAITKPSTLELSNYEQVGVDVDKINNSSSITPDGETTTLNESGKFDKQVTSIAHGIGHNLGMIHDDNGIMLNAITYQEKKEDANNKTYYYLNFDPNHVTKENTQNLSSRIGEMTKLGRDYWKGKYDCDKNNLSGSGVTKMQENLK